jgi:hypothetical protein
MPMEHIEWILREVGRDGKKCRSIDMFLNGDGLTEPRLADICHLSKKYAPYVSTQTFTCGVHQENTPLLLNPDLDSVCFTISGYNRESYLRSHRADNYDTDVKTLSTFLKKKRSTQRCEVHCVVNKYNYQSIKDWWRSFEWAAELGCRRVLSPLVASVTNKPSLEAADGLPLNQVQRDIFEVSGASGEMWNTNNITYPDPCVLWHNCSFEADKAGTYALQCCNWADSRQWNYGTVKDFIKYGLTLKEYWFERQSNLQNNPLCRECNMKAPDSRQRLDWVREHLGSYPLPKNTYLNHEPHPRCDLHYIERGGKRQAEFLWLESWGG